jgi:phosphatidylglycerol:prolipoprotein diacylglycerol transferase
MGVPLAVGFVLALLMAVKRGRRTGFPVAPVCMLSLVVLMSGVVGAKMFFAIFHWHQGTSNLDEFLKPSLQGSGAFGAIILSLPAAILFLRANSMSIWRTLDLISPSIAIVVGFGRIACFFGGCCHGRPTESILGVVFPPNSPAGCTFPGQHVIPTQLFEAFAAFLILFITLIVDRMKRFHGFTFCVLLFLYGADRFGVDFVRFYETEMVLFNWHGYPVPITQIFALGLMIFSVLLGIHLRRKEVAPYRVVGK